ncbi:MAG: ABC transporter ATP-binding protein [Verrucomicrobiota bacterium]|jgi:cobalt/nickel transport system ATP-binding protein|nr:ABC transporter ATP-binding protein [Verrucomicrobiota bacterium]MDD8047109.1 ABC transporter ATP-binding protein [Verrucomicrobiota bacterium]MDI9385267.1 ABC transporter ATP-binding protein [Verrucomicrobiota bacterium]HCF94863.1 cobalt ABC transporter ATP-binding protein [Verrucomicrobiota bacterium]
MSHHIVEARDLAYAYPDGTRALKGVSFRITHGESVALVGPNGAGKSTLLLQLNGFLRPTQGEVRIGNLPITPKTLDQIRRTVGVIFQDPDDQLFMPTVREDVTFGPLNMGFPRQEAESIAEAVLAQVGMSDIADRAPYHLSAGQKRAVAIAAVLAMSPDILVLDEPSSHLDPKGRRRLIDLLHGFSHTKIIATHDLDLALDLCPRTIVIADGRVREDGPTLRLFQDQALLEECALELPLRMQGCPICHPQHPPSPSPGR